MKKKLLTRTLGIFLSVTMMLSSVPVYATSVPFSDVENDSVEEAAEFTSEEESIEENAEISAEEITEPEGGILSLEEVSEEETEDVIFSEGDSEELEDEESVVIFSEGDGEEVEEEGSEDISPEGTSYTQSSGALNFVVVFPGRTDATSKLNISGASTSIDFKTKRMSGLAYTISNVAGIGLATDKPSGNSDWSWNIFDTEKEAKTAADYFAKNGTNINDTGFNKGRNKIWFTIPKGYRVKFNYKGGSGANGETRFAEGSVQYKPGFAYVTKYIENNAYSSYVASDTTFSMIAVQNFGQYGLRGAGQETITLTFEPASYTLNFNSNGGTAYSATTVKYAQGVTNWASYSPSKSYTLTYNANGGSTSGSVPTAATSTFNGWYSGSTKLDASSASTLTATNGGSATISASWSGGSVTLPSATKAGYTFGGWYTNAALTQSAGAAGSTFTPTANTTLYAKWITNSYTVKFNGNGATGGSMGDQSIAYDTNTALNKNAFTRTGYTFNGWSGTGGPYTDGQTVNNIVTSGSVTLTAQWKANTYNVTYDGNGATGGSTAGHNNCVYDQTYKYSNNGFEKKYTINYDSNGGTADRASDTYLYDFAGWTANGNTVQPNTDFKNLATSGTVTVKANWSAPTAITLPSATKVGYDFFGWDNITDAESESNQIIPTENKTLTAKWNPHTYKVKLDPAGGTIADADKNKFEDETKAEFIAVYDEAFSLKAPVRDGYTFKGWKSGADTYAADQEIMNLSADQDAEVTLTAQWEANEVEITVTYKYTDGKKATKTIKTKGLVGSTATIYAPDEELYETPAPQVIKVAPTQNEVTFNYLCKKDVDLSGVVDKVENVISKIENLDPEIQKKIESVKNYISSVKTISGLTEEQLKELKEVVSEITGMEKQYSEKLIETIKESTSISEDAKKELINAILSGTISKEEYDRLASLVNASSLSAAEKQKILEGLQSITDNNALSLAEQKKILAALEGGSSATYNYGGITYTLTKNPDGTLTIGLKGLNGAKEVVIPDSVTVAGKTYAVTEVAKASFKDNATLEKVTMGPNITKICDDAFNGCTALKSVTIGKNVQTIGARAFKGCTSLTKIKIPKSVLKIGTSAFENCTALKTVTLNEGLLEIGTKAFYNCKVLSKIKIPKSVLKIKKYAFGKCVKMKELKFADGSLLTTLQSGVFSDCKALKKVKLPEKLTAIPLKTFYNCVKLESVTGMKAVTKIGESAFSKCTKLEKFTITSKVQTIGEKAFYGCKNLKNVTIKSKVVTSVGKNAFKKCKKNIKIKCPDSKVKAYTKLLKGKY